MDDQILENRNIDVKDVKSKLEKDKEILESLDTKIRKRIEEVLSDNIEKHRYKLESGFVKEEVTSRLIEILRGYKEDVQFFEKLIEKNYKDEPIDLYEVILDIRRGDVDFLIPVRNIEILFVSPLEFLSF